MAEFSSRGVGNAGLTTGIIGTSLGALNSGLLGNLFGGGMWGGNCNGYAGAGTFANRYELELQQKIGALESGIALRDACIYIDGKLEAVNAKIAEQAVFNAASTAAQNCMAAQIAQLFNLTRLVIPNGSVCPGWGNVTVTPEAAPATGA